MSRAVALCTKETASCLIPHILYTLRTPCPCAGRDDLILTGEGYDGRPVTITIKKGVLEVEGMAQEELDQIAERRCLKRTENPESLSP